MWITRDEKGLKLWDSEPAIFSDDFSSHEEWFSHGDSVIIPDHEKWSSVKWEDLEPTKLTDALEIETYGKLQCEDCTKYFDRKDLLGQSFGTFGEGDFKSGYLCFECENKGKF